MPASVLMTLTYSLICASWSEASSSTRTATSGWVTSDAIEMPIQRRVERGDLGGVSCQRRFIMGADSLRCVRGCAQSEYRGKASGS